MYNSCLDFMKGIACIFVIFMHCEFPGRLGIFTQTISRFCVPFFFMVSGYFSYRSMTIGCDSHGIYAIFNKKVKHILQLIVGSTVVYLSFVIIQSLLFNNINWSVHPERILQLICFNRPFIISGQYWFLFALLYVYVLYAVIERYNLYKQSYYLAAFMFVLYFSLAQGMHAFGGSVPNFYYRNFLVEGFPFFMLGHWIHKNQSNLCINNNLLLALIALTTILCIPERYLFRRDFGVNIMTLPQVFCLFLYAVNNPLKNNGLIQEMGKRYSMYIYILHPIIWYTLRYVYDYLHISDNLIAQYLMPIEVLVFTILLSFIVEGANRSISKKIQISNA